MAKSNFKIDSFSAENLYEDLEKGLFSEDFTLKDLGISARVLQNWSEKGVLPDKKRKEDENHKFNFVELMWLKLVFELRIVGLPLERIRKVKEMLFEKKSLIKLLNVSDTDDLASRLYSIYAHQVKDKQRFMEVFSTPEMKKKANSPRFSFLHILLYQFIQDRQPIKIVVFNDGSVLPYMPHVHDKNIDLMEVLEKETTVSVPLFKLILNFIEDENNFNFISKGVILNFNEIQILQTIRNGKFQKVTIHFKNSKPKILETTELLKLNKEARLSEILLSQGYETIEITTQAGVVSYSPKTTKHILK